MHREEALAPPGLADRACGCVGVAKKMQGVSLLECDASTEHRACACVRTRASGAGRGVQVHFLLCSEAPRSGLADLAGVWHRGGLLGTGAQLAQQHTCSTLLHTEKKGMTEQPGVFDILLASCVVGNVGLRSVHVAGRPTQQLHL